MFNDLTIVIPIKKPPNLDLFISENRTLLQSSAHKIIIDSGGGRQFRDAHGLGFLPLIYEAKDIPLWEARKFGYNHTVTPFILNIDCDVVLPLEYIEDALLHLQNDKAEAIAIHFEPIKTGHLEFGTSTWKANVLRKLYDYSRVQHGEFVKIGANIWTGLSSGFCECTYMWSKLLNSGGRLETLCYRAKHLK